MKSSSLTSALPDPTPLLFLLAATLVLACWIAEDAWPAWSVIGAIFGACALYFSCKDRLIAVAVLAGAAAMPALAFQVFGLNARPEHFAIGILCFASLLWWKLATRSNSPIRWITADYFLLAYITMNIFSSLFMSVAPAQTAKWAFQQILAILAYFVLRILATDRKAFNNALYVALGVAALEGAYAIVCFFSNLIFDTTFGMAIGQYGSIPGTYGTQFEANLLGSYTGASAIVLLGLYLKGRRNVFLAGYAITMGAMLVSLSRAAVMGTLIALSLFTFLSLRVKKMTKDQLRAVGAVTLTVVLALAPALLGSYAKRFEIVDITDVSTIENVEGRIVTTVIALDNILEHPLLGNGTASFQILSGASELDPTGQYSWIGNTEWRVLHDTGLVGLAVFILFLVYLSRVLYRILKREAHIEMLALTAAALVYCMTFQFTEGTLLAFPWVHLGFLGCAVSIYTVKPLATEEA